MPFLMQPSLFGTIGARLLVHPTPNERVMVLSKLVLLSQAALHPLKPLQKHSHLLAFTKDGLIFELF